MQRVLLFTMLFALMCAPARAQAITPAQVPAVVSQAMRARFPAVKKVEWKIKTDKNYEAEFFVKDVEWAVKFDASGKWLESEWAVSGNH